MIEEAYVSFETAKLLKEKGFPQDPNICNTAYTAKGKFSNNAKSFAFYYELIKPRVYYTAPTLQMAMKWLRKMHNIHIDTFVIKNYDKKICEYTYTIMDLNFPGSDDGIDCCNKYKTYEEAVEASLEYSLKNLI